MENEIKNKISSEMEEEINKHRKALKEKIKKYLTPDKPVDVLIMKANLICEYYVNHILILKEKASAQEINELNFFVKINKAFNQQDDEQKKLRDRLVKLNNLRNRVGHELEYVLSEYDVDCLGYLTGKEYVLEKYNYEDKKQLLYITLLYIVIDVALFVTGLVTDEKLIKKHS